jgi:hypothetical protein
MLSHDPDGSIPQRKLGSILVSEGMVTEEQLEEALEVQKTDTSTWAEILVALGYLDDEDLACALSIRLNVEYVGLRGTRIAQRFWGS